MPEKLVWYPGRSRAAESPQPERGRGSTKMQPASSKPSITALPGTATKKKKTMHVSAAKDSPSVSHSSYSTMERGGDTSLLDYSTLSSSTHKSEFTGWQDEELGARLSGVGGVEISGPRNGMISRLDTRFSQRRRGEDGSYQFTHLLEAHEHMEHYRTHYCYTTLACAPPQNSPAVSDLVDQGQQALLKLEVRSLYRGDPFLMELASRLGVGDSIREPQLLTPHRHTAPSIVKKPRNKADLVIDLTPKPRSDEEEDDTCTPGLAWTVDNTKHTDCPLELPKISEVPIKTDSSTISINKYLRVNCHGEEPEGTVLPQVPTSGTQLSSTSDVTTEQLTESSLYERPVQVTEEITPNRINPLVQNKPSIHTLNRAQKEKLISATAQLLGLSSREWAGPNTNRRLNHYDDYSSRPSTHRQQERNNKRNMDKQQQTRTATRQETKKIIESQPSPARQKTIDSQSRPATRQKKIESYTRPQTRQESKKVIESRSPSRQLNTTSHTREKLPLTKRPQSTLARHKAKLDRLKSIYSQSSSIPSRPQTHLHTRAKEVEQDTLDGSSYWNDLRIQTSHRKEARKNETKRDNLTEMSTSQKSKSLSGKVLKNRTKVKTNSELTPGSSPLEIARHIARFKQKFDRVLNIQSVTQQ